MTGIAHFGYRVVLCVDMEIYIQLELLWCASALCPTLPCAKVAYNAHSKITFSSDIYSIHLFNRSYLEYTP